MSNIFMNDLTPTLAEVRTRIMVPAKASKDELETLAMGDARVQELIEGKQVRKVIVVPGKLVNIVAN